MAGLNVKDEARRLIDRLPEEATWDDIQEEIDLHRAIEEGLKDLDEGRTLTHEEVRRRFRQAANEG